jgi:hypothetical protein
MIPPLLSVETPPSVANQATMTSFSVAVGSSPYACHAYSELEIIQRVIENQRLHRTMVTDETPAVSEIVPATLILPSDRALGVGQGTLLADFLVVQESVTPNDYRLESSGPTLRRRWIPSNTVFASQEQIYFPYPAIQWPFVSRTPVIEARWLGDIEAKISGLASGPKARITKATADRACVVVRQFPADLPSPQVVSSVDGDVLFIWYNRGDHVEVDVDLDGHTTWFGKFSGAYESGEDVHDHALLPPSLQEMLRRLHG